MKAWLQYALAGLVLVGLVAGAMMWFVAPADREAIRWRNAAKIFPPGAFPGLTA